MARVARDRDRALQQDASTTHYGDGEGDDTMAADEGMIDGIDTFGSKVVVIQPGSQNLRIGLASDALPKTVPMCVARRLPAGVRNEEIPVAGSEPKAKRRRVGEVTEPYQADENVRTCSPTLERTVTNQEASSQNSTPA